MCPHQVTQKQLIGMTVKDLAALCESNGLVYKGVKVRLWLLAQQEQTTFSCLHGVLA
jgi:hypothetical protein